MSVKIKGFDAILKSLENAEKTAKDVKEGKLTINTDYLKEHINEFNSTYPTNLTVDSAEDEILNFFKQTYFELIQKTLLENKSAKTVFNDKFKNYASVE